MILAIDALNSDRLGPIALISCDLQLALGVPMRRENLVEPVAGLDFDQNVRKILAGVAAGLEVVKQVENRWSFAWCVACCLSRWRVQHNPVAPARSAASKIAEPDQIGETADAAVFVGFVSTLGYTRGGYDRLLGGCMVADFRGSSLYVFLDRNAHE
jgi:hypothetical protein